MACIFQLKNSWRAQLCVGGVRDSAVFPEKFEAESWAKKREIELKTLKDSIVSSRRIEKNKKIFKDIFLTFDETEIVGTSIPLPKTSGVYFLIKDNSVVYVGKSENINARLQQHLYSKKFDRINIVECSFKDLTRLESLYIKKFSPILNLVGKETYSKDDLVFDLISH